MIALYVEARRSHSELIAYIPLFRDEHSKSLSL